MTDESMFGDIQDENVWTDASTVMDEPEEKPKEDKSKDEEIKPKVVTARTSTQELVTLIWSGVGTIAQRSGFDPPVGRMMQLQAPLAGNKIDALLANTWLDHLLQPIARKGDAMQEVGAILLGPILIGLLERNPAAVPMIEPMLREVIYTSLIEMAPILKKKQRDQRAAARAMADVSEAFNLPPGADPFDAIMGHIFGAGEQTESEAE